MRIKRVACCILGVLYVIVSSYFDLFSVKNSELHLCIAHWPHKQVKSVRIGRYIGIVSSIYCTVYNLYTDIYPVASFCHFLRGAKNQI